MNIRFDLQQKNKAKLYQIHIIFSDKFFKKEVKYYTGRTINPSEWNKEKYRGRGPIHNGLNSRLSSLEGMGRTIFDQLEKENKIDRDEFRRRLLIMDGKEEKARKSEKTVWNYLDEWRTLEANKISKVTKRKLSDGSVSRIDVMINNLKRFDKVYKFKLSPYSIATEDFYNKFAKYYTGKDEEDLGNELNSFADPIKHIKRFCKWLKKQLKDISSDFEEFQRTEIYDDDKIEALYPEEIESLWKLDLSLMPQVEMSYWIGMNLLSTGIRISDHNFYNPKEHIRRVEGMGVSGHVLTFKNVKAKTECNAPFIDDELFKPALVHSKFMELFGDKPTKTGHDLNRDLPVIFKAARINRLVKEDGSRIFRKSFATNRVRQGYDIPEVMKMGGWKDEKQFRRYLGLDKVDILAKAIEKKNEKEKIEQTKVA